MDVDARSKRHSFTAAEVVRNFAVARELAAEHPVMITHHGRPTHVLVTIGDYHSSQVERSGLELMSNPLHEIAEWIPDGTIVCDRNLDIIHINRVAAAMVRRTAEEVEATPLSALPGMAESHLLSLIQRTNATNEFATVQMASPFAPDAWVEVRCFPWRERNVLFIRDITDRLDTLKMADTKSAILEAMNEHGRIGYVRLSLRGTIENLDEPFAGMTGVPSERLKGLPLVNLVPTSDRVVLRDALEDVLTGGARRKIELSMLDNKGETIPVAMALAGVKGMRGVTGAVAVVTAKGE